MKIIFTTILLFVLMAQACTAQKSEPVKNPADTKPENAGAQPTDELEKQIALLAAPAKGRVGVKAEVLETGETVSLNAAEHFPMQSVYKLPIGMAVLSRIDAGQIKLDQKIRVEK